MYWIMYDQILEWIKVLQEVYLFYLKNKTFWNRMIQELFSSERYVALEPLVDFKVKRILPLFYFH